MALFCCLLRVQRMLSCSPPWGLTSLWVIFILSFLRFVLSSNETYQDSLINVESVKYNLTLRFLIALVMPSFSKKRDDNNVKNKLVGKHEGESGLIPTASSQKPGYRVFSLTINIKHMWVIHLKCTIFSLNAVKEKCYVTIHKTRFFLK